MLINKVNSSWEIQIGGTVGIFKPCVEGNEDLSCVGTSTP